MEQPRARGSNRSRLLIEGRPGAGKTTVARRLIEQLRGAGIPVDGFITEEMRDGGKRTGFAIERLGGARDRDVLAHVSLRGPPRVGRYGVDVAAVERVALPALAHPPPGGIVVVDELGKMELASTTLQEAFLGALAGPAAVVATVHVHRHPFTDALKARPDVDRITVTASNRQELPQRLAARLLAAVGG
jgi:nucleoside-triphosphatase